MSVANSRNVKPDIDSACMTWHRPDKTEIIRFSGVVSRLLTLECAVVLQGMTTMLFRQYSQLQQSTPPMVGSDDKYRGNDCFAKLSDIYRLWTVDAKAMSRVATIINDAEIGSLSWLTHVEPYERQDFENCDLDEDIFIAFSEPFFPIVEHRYRRDSFSRHGFVYILECEGLYKIGKANDLESRTKILGIQIPFETTLVHAIQTSDPLALESYWHSQFADKRLKGEWFHLGDEDLLRLCMHPRMEVV